MTNRNSILPRCIVTVFSLIIAINTGGCFLAEKAVNEMRVHNMTIDESISVEIPETSSVLLQPGQSQAYRAIQLTNGFTIQTPTTKYTYEWIKFSPNRLRWGMLSLTGEMGNHVNLYVGKSGLIYLDPKGTETERGNSPVHSIKVEPMTQQTTP